MKFSIGDKILLKQTGEEGHVTAYINAAMLEVEVGGTTFPVHMDDIDHPYLKWFTDKTKKKTASLPDQLPVEKITQRQQRLARGIYLSFMPVFKPDDFEDIVDHIKVYLLNELPQSIKVHYDARFFQQSEFAHEGTLHGFGHLYLHNISYADMNDQPRFHWKVTDVADKKVGPSEGILRIRPQKLFEHINDVLKKNEPTFAYMLIDEFRPEVKKEQPDKYEPYTRPNVITAATSSIGAAKYEIDLHIEQLIDNTRGLTNAEIVKIQMDTLEKYIHLAIVHRQDRMIVIHGLGKGKLKDDVHAVLKRIPEVSRYKNEWSGKYGFGATEVFFKY